MPYVPTPDYTEYKPLKTKAFARLAQRRIELKQLKDDVERELKDLNETLMAELMAADAKSVLFEGFTFGVVESAGQKRLDKALLLKFGVKPETLEKATVLGKPSIYLSVREAKDQGEED